MTPEVTLVASPFANLGNIHRALLATGASVEVTAERSTIARSNAVVLPGVGNFAPAARWLRASGVGESLAETRDNGGSILGICVGHQLLFDGSEEGGGEEGLGFIRGTVRRFDGGLPVPQIGWNRVGWTDDPLFDAVPTESCFYFVHSYHATGVEEDAVIASAYYAGDYVVAAREGRVAGVQFHPERSSAAGLRVLSNYVRHAFRGEVHE